MQRQSTLGDHIRQKRAARQSEAPQPKLVTNRAHQGAIKRAQKAARAMLESYPNATF